MRRSWASRSRSAGGDPGAEASRVRRRAPRRPARPGSRVPRRIGGGLHARDDRPPRHRAGDRLSVLLGARRGDHSRRRRPRPVRRPQPRQTARTLLVFPTDLLPAVWPSASARVAATERTRTTRDVIASGLAADGQNRLDRARAEVLAALADAPEGRPAQNVRRAVPMIDVKVTTSAASTSARTATTSSIAAATPAQRPGPTGAWWGCGCRTRPGSCGSGCQRTCRPRGGACSRRRRNG